MPPIELYVVLLTVIGAGWLTRRLAVASWMRRGYAALLLAALAAQLALVGPHWQMLPAYAAALVVALVLGLGAEGSTWRAAGFGALLLAPLTVVALLLVPMFRLPAPTGRYAVGTTGPLNWTDGSRSLSGDAAASGPRRELVVQIWYPVPARWRWRKPARYARWDELSLVRSYQAELRTNARLGAPIAEDASFPVLVFGHRWGGERTQDTFLVEELASHGYVVVAMDHPLNAAGMERGDGSVVKSDRANALSNVEASSAARIEGIWAKELGIWTRDDQFVLDEMQRNNAGWFNGRLDFTKVGAFGHSFGGAAALALLGVDPRVKCAVNLDGWTFQALDHRTNEAMLAVYQGDSAIRRPETGVEGELDRADDAVVDGSLQRFGGLRAYVAGTQHLDFTDQTLYSPLQRLTHTGPIKGERIRFITRELLVGFMDRQLKGEGEIPQFPEVKLERWPAPR